MSAGFGCPALSSGDGDFGASMVADMVTGGRAVM